MSEFFDDLEVRDPAVRETALMTALPGQVAHAKAQAPFYADHLAEIDPAAVTDRAALAKLPVLRKSDLMALQKSAPPLGGMTTVAPGRLQHVFVSPGPIYDPEGVGGDPWRYARALYAAGMRPGDLVHNCFSYHLVPAGMMFDLTAHTLGCAVVPSSVGQTDIKLQAIADLKPVAYAGTPSFLKILLEKAAEDSINVSSMTRAAVGAEPFPPSVRQAMQDLGVTALQNYGTGDLGLVAYERAAVDSMILGEGIIVEILRPGTGDPVADGEVGEVVVTNLDPAYPLILFATGDMSAVLPGISPCGRTNTRIKGWMGRADQTTKVRAMFVHPGQINDVVQRHGEVIKARLTVDSADGRDSMVLTCEVAEGVGDAALEAAICETVQNVTKLRDEVNFTGPGMLPNDGKVIDDIRTFE
ncbi:MAG: phenylacetate--CoA ligase family protein [Thalassobaculaceae bacterium]